MRLVRCCAAVLLRCGSAVLARACAHFVLCCAAVGLEPILHPRGQTRVTFFVNMCHSPLFITHHVQLNNE